MADDDYELLRQAKEILAEDNINEADIDNVRQLPLRSNRKNYGKEAIFKRRFMVNRLSAAGFSNLEISNALRMSKETVNKDREYARNLYTQKILESQDLHRARLLEEAMLLKNKAIVAFENSKTKRTVVSSNDGKQTITEVTSAGDPGFLNVAKNLIAEQFKIVGLDKAPQAKEESKSYHDFLQDIAKAVEKREQQSDEIEEKEKAIEVEFRNAEDVGPNGTVLLRPGDNNGESKLDKDLDEDDDS